MSDPATHLHLGAYARCLDAAGRLLLARMATGPDRGRWTLPGGGVEPLEHPDDAVLRELLEEAGVGGVAAGPVLGIYSRTYDRRWGLVHHVGIVYDVAGVTGELRHEQDGSTDRCDWFTPAELETLPLVPLADFGVELGRRPLGGVTP